MMKSKKSIKKHPSIKKLVDSLKEFETPKTNSSTKQEEVKTTENKQIPNKNENTQIKQENNSQTKQQIKEINPVNKFKIIISLILILTVFTFLTYEFYIHKYIGKNDNAPFAINISEIDIQIKTCDNLVNSSRIDECKILMIRTYNYNNPLNLKLCDYLKNVSRDKCINLLEIDNIVKTGKIVNCNKFTNEEDKSQCVNSIIMNKVINNLNISECLNIIDNNSRNHCFDIFYYYNSKKMNDSNMCNQIQEDILRERCINSNKYPGIK